MNLMGPYRASTPLAKPLRLDHAPDGMSTLMIGGGLACSFKAAKMLSKGGRGSPCTRQQLSHAGLGALYPLQTLRLVQAHLEAEPKHGVYYEVVLFP